MANKEALKRQIREELQEHVSKKRAEIKKLEENASNERFLSTTVRGGALAAAAESACLNRARDYENQANMLKREIAWHEEMLKKYC